MASSCPACGEDVSATALSCKHCGAEFEPAVAAKKKPRDMGDGAKYGIIIGGLLIAVVVIVGIASGMGGSKTCPDCRGRKTIVCTNCKDGRPKCSGCKGTGRDPQTYSTCQRCSGKGDAAACPKCQGKERWSCTTCSGSGSLQQ